MSFSLNAQNEIDSDIGEKTKIEKKKHYLRLGLTPSALLNIYPGLQINGAIVISDNFLFTAEAGRIFYSVTSNEDAIKGYRLRPGLRYYFSDQENSQFHISLAVNYRATNSERIGHFDVLNIPTVVISKFNQKRTLKGLATILGVDYWISSNMVLDLGLGLGYNRLITEDLNAPANSSRKFSSAIKYDAPAQYDVPLFIFNVKVQYLF